MPQNSPYTGRPTPHAAGSDPAGAAPEELADFVNLIGLLYEVLTPVGPSEAFRAALGRELLVAGRARQEEILARQGKRRLASPWTLVAAAAASAVSVVVGIITFIIWHRTRPAAG
jgi:hypothetical protein